MEWDPWRKQAANKNGVYIFQMTHRYTWSHDGAREISEQDIHHWPNMEGRLDVNGNGRT